MSKREKRIPGDDHFITIAPYPNEVVVTAASDRIAASRSALVLKEADYPEVFYIPRDDVDMSLLVSSDHTTFCPYKGDASYFSIPALGTAGKDSVWSYEEPFEAVLAIEGHLAFYTDRVSVEASA